jgi:hypothetical protein
MLFERTLLFFASVALTRAKSSGGSAWQFRAAEVGLIGQGK